MGWEGEKGKSPTSLDVCETFCDSPSYDLSKWKDDTRANYLESAGRKKVTARRINSNERAHMVIRKENASFTW